MQEITQKQIEKWQSITREKDGGEKYAKAQFNLGVSWDKAGDVSKVREHGGNIERA